jgi:hypothetical protein
MKIFHIGICTGTNGLTKAFRENSSDYREIASSHPSLNSEAIRIAEEFRPDIVFMQIQCEGVIHKSTVQRLRQLGAWVANWNGDVRDTCPPWMISIGKDVSVSLFTNMRDVHEMRSAWCKSAWLEIGYDQEIFRPEGSGIPTKDIVFFGNNAHSFPMSRFRVDMCNFMKRKFPDQFGVYGIGNGANGNFNHSQIEEAAAYRSSKIAINVSHYEIENYTSDRMLRILGMGTPICLAKRYPGIYKNYTDGVHLRMWDTLEELEGLCHYYMDPANERERSVIARQGMAHVQKHFTFDQMVKNLLTLHANDSTN